MSKISVVIVNYNGKDTLFECLTNLTNNLRDIEIVVFDNASTDGAPSMVEEQFANVKLIKSKTNKGIAYGYNRALKHTSSKFILYLGSDAFPSQQVLDNLVEYLKSNTHVGLVTAKLLDRHGVIDLDAHRGFPTPWVALTHFTGLSKLFSTSKIFNGYFLGYKNMSTPHEIDACISHFMLTKKEVIDQVGGWDEDYFVYGEDIDFCFRIKQAGYKIMYLPEYEVLHYKGTTVGIRKNTQDISRVNSNTKLDMKKASVKAMEIFYTKHYKTKYPRALTMLVLVGLNLMLLYRVISFKIRNAYAN